VQCETTPHGEMCLVPKGPFWMGCNEAVDDECSTLSNEKPYHKVGLSEFKIDKYLVTVKDYSDCVGSSACTAATTGAECNWGISGRDNHPINCVDWNQAKAFCEWASKRLPTEAEWEKAARGPDGLKYPWGNSPKVSCEYAVMADPNAGGPGCGSGGTMPVGSKPKGASPYGVEDMIGNVFEWVADWMSSTYYQSSPSQDPMGPTSGTERVNRGGAYGITSSNSYALRASVRNSHPPTYGSNSGYGFRCAAAPCYPNCPPSNLIEVPAGDFWMGCNSAVDTECDTRENPYHVVTVPTFVIDKIELTASEYKACVTTGGCTAARTDSGCNFGVSGKEDHPINCVDWNQAKAYCSWAGKRLLTESEWEKAARGLDGRKYPWGNDPLDCDHAVMSVSPCSSTETAPVGSKPLGASPFGVMDMVGNVWEWVEDDYHTSYSGAPTDGSAWVDDPRLTSRVTRGGGFADSNSGYQRCSSRSSYVPEGKLYLSIGFRCAKGFGFEWYDPINNLTWKVNPAGTAMDWPTATNFCGGLGGGWRLPTISELRSIIRGCPNAETSGACGVTDTCLGMTCRDSCVSCDVGGGPDDGCYWVTSLEGACGSFWTSSVFPPDQTSAWALHFTTAFPFRGTKTDPYAVRCVRTGP
jgi:formylglycine-generating enzyme required for sulfatase activity